MTPAEQLRALHVADLRTSVPRVDHGRLRRRAHRVVALRLVRAVGLAAVSALVLFLAGAQLPVAIAGEPAGDATDGPVVDGDGGAGDDGGSGDDGEVGDDGETDDDGDTDGDGGTDDGETDDDGEVESLADLVVGVDRFGSGSWTLTVKNDGDGDAGPFVIEVTPGELLEFQNGLPAGGSEERSIDPCDTREAEQLVASVDPDGRVPEADETNNTAQHPCDEYVE